jgi:hypothetical protein
VVNGFVFIRLCDQRLYGVGYLGGKGPQGRELVRIKRGARSSGFETIQNKSRLLGRDFCEIDGFVLL